MNIIVDNNNVVWYWDEGTITRIDDYNWRGTDKIIADPVPLISKVVEVNSIPSDIEIAKYRYINNQFELNPEY
jgi:hypothetical protein